MVDTFFLLERRFAVAFGPVDPVGNVNWTPFVGPRVVEIKV
jgi:hypothetical protein